MKIKHLMPILITAISLILAINSVVAEERIRTTDEIIDYQAEVGDQDYEEPLIAPAPDSNKDLDLITDEYADVVGEDLPDDMPHILDVSNGEDNPEITFGEETENKASNSERKALSLKIPMLIILGMVGLVIIGLLILKRR